MLLLSYILSSNSELAVALNFSSMAGVQHVKPSEHILRFSPVKEDREEENEEGIKNKREKHTVNNIIQHLIRHASQFPDQFQL